MIRKSKNVYFGLIVACAGTAFGQDPAADPIQSNLFPPELLMQHREQIGLTQEQAEQIQSNVQAVTVQADALQQELGLAVRKLAQQLASDQVDESSALGQLDRILELEKQLKHLHLRLMIGLKNNMTPEQQQKAASVKREPGEVLRARLQSKVRRIEKEMSRRVGLGEHPIEVVEMMNEFQKRIQGGRPRQAEQILNRVLNHLQLDESAEAPRREGESP